MQLRFLYYGYLSILRHIVRELVMHLRATVEQLFHRIRIPDKM